MRPWIMKTGSTMPDGALLRRLPGRRQRWRWRGDELVEASDRRWGASMLEEPLIRLRLARARFARSGVRGR